MSKCKKCNKPVYWKDYVQGHPKFGGGDWYNEDDKANHSSSTEGSCVYAKIKLPDILEARKLDPSTYPFMYDDAGNVLAVGLPAPLPKPDRLDQILAELKSNGQRLEQIEIRLKEIGPIQPDGP